MEAVTFIFLSADRFLLFSSLSSSYRPVKHAAYPLSGLQERLLPYTYSDRVIAEAAAPLFIIFFQVSINTARRGMQFVQMMRMSQMEEKKFVKLFLSFEGEILSCYVTGLLHPSHQSLGHSQHVNH